MKILICDDERIYLDELHIHVAEYMNFHHISCSIELTTDPESILKSNISYDLAFLDIQMENITGISLAKELKNRNNKIVIFFITNYNNFQDDAMDVNAFRFFEKPFQVERLYSGIDKAMEYINESYIDIFFFEPDSQKRILIDDIRYIKRENRKIFFNIHGIDHVAHKSFEYWIEKIPVQYFYLVHKSYFINLHYIETYKYTELFLIDGTRIPIAPRKQANFHKYWFEYLRRR